jgi:hypothetical protein
MATKSETQLYREWLLAILKDEKKPVSIAEIAVKGKKRNLSTLRRHLNWLAGEGKVIKLPGRGAAFTYKYRHPVEASVDAHREATSRDIKPQALSGLLRSFAKNRWESSLVKSSRALPYCVRKLYEFAHDTALGGARTQGDYDYVRSELRAFHDDLVNTLSTVRGMLDTEELWNAKKSASWLLSAGGTADEYGDLANQAQEMQK